VDGEVIAEKRSGVRHQLVPDPLGSTIALLDNTQTQTDTFTYWPYGEEQSRTGTTATPLRFVGTLGYYRDSSTRTYVRARYLNTQQGRWTTQDPIGFDGGDANLYGYIGGRPTVSVDPSGTFNCLLCLAGLLLSPIVAELCAVYCLCTKPIPVTPPHPSTDETCSDLEERGFIYRSLSAALKGEGMEDCRKRKEDKNTSCKMGGRHYGYQCEDGYHSILCCNCINENGQLAQRCGVDLGNRRRSTRVLSHLAGGWRHSIHQ